MSFRTISKACSSKKSRETIVNGISPIITNAELVEMTKLGHIRYLSSYYQS
jgi:hypothetical protein